MSENTKKRVIYTRVQNMYATPHKWSIAAEKKHFVPLKGEIILHDNNEYDAAGNVTAINAPDIFVGDGETRVDRLMSAGGRITRDLTFTEPFGKFNISSDYSSDDLYDIEHSTSSFYTLKTKGLRTEDLLSSAFGTDKDPEITDPRIDISPKANGTTKWTFEVGTEVVVSCAYTNATDGEYSYGPDETGVTWTYNTSFASKTITKGVRVEFEKVSSNEFIDGYSQTLNCQANYSAATERGKTALGQISDVRISEGSYTDTKTLTSYREGFYCGTMNTKVDPSSLTSNQIRSLTATEAAYKSGSYEMDIPVNAAVIILACPADKTGVTDVYNSTVNANMMASFIKTAGITVYGANGVHVKEYNVWTYTPEDAYSNAAKLTITLG